MKIIQVMAGGPFGGAETAFVDLCLALHEAGQKVYAITRANAGRVPQLQNAGITVYTLPFGGKLDAYTYIRMRQIIRTIKPDIIQTWMSRASASVPRWTKKMNIPPYKTVARLGGYYKMKYFKNTDHFVGITPDICQYLRNSGVGTASLSQINNFAEVHPVEKRLQRSDFNVPDDATLLLGLGRLHVAKAFDTLIKAVAECPEHIYLWIAGEGPERKNLENLIDSLGVTNRVRLLGWRDDRAALFQAADICAFSSRFEPFGTVFVQAWGQGTPLITTASDGPKQFVKDGKDALLVPIDDITAMKKAILRLSSDPKLRTSLINAGKSRYESEFTKERCVNTYLELYKTLSAEKP